MENNKITVRQATTIDCTKLEQFYMKVWPNRSIFKYPDRYLWIIKENPYLNNFKGIPIWIGLKDGAIVGHTSAMLVKVKIGSEIILAGMSIDTIVQKEARGLGLGQKLQKINQDAHSVFMALSDIAPINYKIKKKIGGLEGPNTYIFAYISKIDYINSILPIIKKIPFLKSRLTLNLLELFYFDKLITNIHNLIFAKKKSSPKQYKLVFEKIIKFDKRTDLIWEKKQEKIDFAVVRESKYMNWKYIDQPNISYEKFIIKDDLNDIGILIYRNSSPPEPKIGVIVELFLIEDNNEWMIDSLNFSVNNLVNRGAHTIYFATADSLVFKNLKEVGFKCIERQNPIIYLKDKKNLDFSRMRTYITRGEQDWDQYPMSKAIQLKSIYKKNILK